MRKRYSGRTAVVLFDAMTVEAGIKHVFNQFAVERLQIDQIIFFG